MKKRLLNIVGDNKGWAIPNRAKNLAVHLGEYFDITDFFQWDLPEDFNDYDLIHMHHPVPNKKINDITTKWGAEVSSERELLRVLNLKICEKADFVIAKNQYLFHKIRGLCKLCYYIPNGVDTKLFKPDAIRVGWVGNDTSSEEYRLHKGTDLIGKACQELDYELRGLFKVVFVKDPSCYPEIYPQKDVVNFYKSLDVFVLASKTEGSSNVVLEALAMGLPVVTTKVGNWNRLNKSGLIISVERNIKSIRDGIRKAVQDRIKRRQIVKLDFNWASHARQYLDIYRKIGVL